MNEPIIRKVSIDDIDDLQAISIQTFAETFGAVNTAENIKSYLEKNLNKEKLTEEIQDKNSQFYFAILDDIIIGYLKLNSGSAQTEIAGSNSVEIERIYVSKEYHGKRIAPFLFEKAKQVAIQSKADFLWLGVWEENSRAIAFYKKNGFTEFDKHVFRLGDDEQTDIMMKLPLG